MTYFNDNDPDCVRWLQNLWPNAHVSSKPIQEVYLNEMPPRAHFFAGIGGWELALQMAGWPDAAPVWTGSLPCQPFSKAAGSWIGDTDERHLWPEFRRLITQYRPPVIFGEQVASRLGREWLSRVRTDLEALGYAVGCADLCAASIGLPQNRPRLYWVAHTPGVRWDKWRQGQATEVQGECSIRAGQLARPLETWFLPGQSQRLCDAYTVVALTDGSQRRIKPGLEPMVNGLPGLVAQLRGFGNSIVPPLAAVFIKSFMEAVELCP